MVYGVTGSGKTTLARAIGEATGLPWHSVDDLTYEANWVQVPDEVQAERIRTICDGPAWVLDTAYGKWLEIPLSKVELIVALDYPRWFSLQRLIRRTARRIIDKKPICNGNRETLRLAFSRDSIILWHFKAFAKKRSRFHKWAANPDGPRIILFRSARETDRWLKSLNSS